MEKRNQNVAKDVAGLVARARKAFKQIEFYRQEQVDELVAAIAFYTAGDKDVVHEMATLALEETRLGDYDSKVGKLSNKPRGVLRDLKRTKTIGIIEEDKAKGLVKIAKPVGVIGALIPSTQPEMIPVVQAMNAIKGRNAVVMAPHPRGKKTTFRMVEIMRGILKKYGAPEDLLICPDNISVEISGEIMKQVDLIMATGGSPMVKAAYSSGTPAYGVGAGNACIIVDETADMKDAAHKIMMSKVNDLSAGCSCDNSVIISEAIYNDMITLLKAEGAYLANAQEKALLQKTIWPNWPNDHVINRDIVASPVSNITKLAGITVPESTKFILVEETGSGVEYPFSGEKMCLVIAIYKYKTFEDAIMRVNANQAYSGAGHSCGIYSKDNNHVMDLALKTYTSRVVVNQPQSLTNTGNFTNGMPMTGSLGCGTWGGNIVSENIVAKHYINTTWITAPIPEDKPTDEELFRDLIKK